MLTSQHFSHELNIEFGRLRAEVVFSAHRQVLLKKMQMLFSAIVLETAANKSLDLLVVLRILTSKKEVCLVKF